MSTRANEQESPKVKEIRREMARYLLNNIAPKELSRWLSEASWLIDDEDFDEDARGLESAKVFIHHLGALCNEFIGTHPRSYKKIAENHLVESFSAVELYGEVNRGAEGTDYTRRAIEFISSKYMHAWAATPQSAGKVEDVQDFMRPLQTIMGLIEIFAEYVYEAQTTKVA